MSGDLYRPDLLRLAADLRYAGRLPAPDGSGKAVNALCGDALSFDVAVQDGRIRQAAHETKACVLAQAAAAVLAAHAPGADAAALADLEAALRAMLREGAPPPAAPWNDFAVLAEAAPYRNRHACVLLPLEALRKALDAAL